MTSLKEYQSLNAPPTVSNDQWTKYAVKKMSAGFLLIISNSRNIARFYKGDGKLENCSFRSAKRLLREGIVEEAGTHMMGTIYQLSKSHKDKEALFQISRSQMGAVKWIEEDEYDDDDDGAEFEGLLTDDVLLDGEDDDQDEDLNAASTE